MSDLSTSLISSLSGISNALSAASKPSESSSDTSFADILSSAISTAENTNTDSNAATLNLLTGNTDDLSSTLITTQKAAIALDLTVAIRNKAVDAYKEIMNMQV